MKELQPMKIRGRGSLTVMEIGLSVVVDRGRGLQQQIKGFGNDGDYYF